MTAASQEMREAIRVEGRSEDKTHATINGVYVKRPGPFHGAPAYEKLGGIGLGRRYLFFSGTERFWKLSGKLDDNEHCLGQLVVPRENGPRSGEEASWMVFDGKQTGYTEDRAVRSVEDEVSVDVVNAPTKKRKSKGTDEAPAVPPDSVDIGASGKKRKSKGDVEAPQQSPPTVPPAKKAKGEEEPEDGEKPAPLIQEDAPPESAAHNMVKTKAHDKVGNARVHFNAKAKNGEKISFQVTVVASGGCEESAWRIARMCYARVENGATKEEIHQFRSDMYAKCAALASGASGGNNSKKPASKRSKKDVVEKKSKGVKADSEKNEKVVKPAGDKNIVDMLQGQDRLMGALRVEGRALEKTNSSINGVYALRKELFGGFSAFEKCGGTVERFLFFSASKKRWKISDRLDDGKTGFAFAKVSDGKISPAALGESVTWSVFDGKEDGYNVDAAVRVKPLVAAPEEDGQGSSSEESADSSGSGSSSSSSAQSDAEVVASETVEAAETVQEEVTKEPVVEVAFPVSKPPRKGRVCAKMLVRSGVRCGCHFAYLRECPSRGVPVS